MIFKFLRKIFKDEEFEELENDKNFYKHDFEEITNQYTELVKKNDELEKKLYELLNPRTDLENYWNNKYPSSIINYSCRHTPNKGGYSLDVRWFFGNVDVDEIQKIVKDWKNLSNDDKMLKCQEWVNKNITYCSDGINYGLNEYWCDAIETLNFRTGDCDDGAILMANLALACGIPYWRVRITAGGVKDSLGNFAGYHAFLTYLPDGELDKEFDKQDWKVCDWCYYNDFRPFNQRPNYKDNILYSGEVWFSFNKKYAFSTHGTKLNY